jgi:translation initiation factor 1
MKKEFSCNGCVKELKQDTSKKIISLSGDQRENVKSFLIKYKILEEKQIKIHGF